MANTIEEINKKYGFDGSTPGGEDLPDTRSAQEVLDQRAAQFEQYMREENNVPIDPARAVMRERVNLAGPEHGGLNFERYYNKGAYKQLGFNPYRDNERYYNENSSSWQDFNDAWNQAGNLFNLGFTSVWSGKSDRQEAEEYARYSNIGSTTRGGVYGTFTNAMLNSGYTIGLLSEIAAEEIALAAGAAATGGAGSPALAARTAYNVRRLAKTGSRISNLVGRIKNLKNAATAKTFWEGARNLGQAVNPLRGTTDYLTTQRAVDAADGVSALAQTGRTFGSFYRDLREIHLAYDEAQLESGFVSNGIKDDLIREHIDVNGEFPTSEDMAKINKEAKQAGDNAKAVNTLLIYGTNRVAFGNVFNKWMPSRLRKGVVEMAGGKVVKNFRTKQLDAIPGGGLLNYKQTLNNIKYTAKNLNKAPLRLAKGIAKYSRTNVGEGVQEYFQEVIQHAEDQMAKDRYAGTVAGGAWYNALHSDEYINQYSKSMDKYMSEEGLDVFTGGFVMGMFAGPFARGSQSVTREIDKHGKSIFNPKKREEKHKEDLERFQEEIDRFNAMTDTKKEFLFDYIDMLQRQTQYAAAMDDDLDEGDKKSFVTNKDHALVEQILFAQRMGAEDLLIEKLKDLSGMSEEDLRDAFSREAGEVQDFRGEDLPARDATNLSRGYKESADKLIKRAEDILRLSEKFDELFPEPVGGGFVDSEFGDARGQKSTLKAAREAAKVIAITNQYDLVRSMERTASILNKISGNQPFWNKDKTPPASEITRIFNGFEITEHLDLIEDTIASLEGIPDADKTDQNRKDLKYNKEMLKLLSEFVSPKGSLTNYINALRTKDFLDLKAKQIEEAGNLEVGSKLRYAYGKSAWGGEIVGETERASDGKPQWKIKKDDGTTTRILKSSTGIVTETVDLEEAAKMMVEPTEAIKKTYMDYLTLVAEHYNNPVNHVGFEESFEDFLDFYALKEDTQNLSQIVNELTNPEAQLALIEQFEKLRRDKFENMEETVKAQLEAYAKSVWLHKLIQSLDKNYNVYIQEDDLIALHEGNQIPKNYYNIETNEPLRKNTATYFKVRKVVRQAMEDEGLIEPKVKTGHSVKEQPNGKFSVLTPEGRVIAVDLETKEEADTLVPDLDAALKETAAEEVKETAEKPTKKPTVEKPKPITFDTPFEEWTDEEVLKAAQLSLDNYNKAQKDAGGVQIEDLEDYLQTDAAKMSKPLTKAIDEYNDRIKEEPAETPKTGTAPPEEPGVITATQEEVLGQLDILKQRRAETELTSKGYVYLNKLYQRVSNFIKGPLEYDSKDSVTNIKNSLPIGNFIDEVGRVVFNNSDVTYEEFLDELEAVSAEKKAGFKNINTEEYFNSVKESVLGIKEELIKKHGEKAVFFTDEIFVNNDLAEKIADEFEGIGGVPDMIVIEEDGSAHIYDFKNKIANTGAIAKNKIEAKYGTQDSNVEGWAKQQSAYSDLLGINGVKISSINAVVFPTQYEREEFTGDHTQDTEVEVKKADIEKRKSILLKKANLEKAPEFAQKAIAKTVEVIDEEVRLQVIEKAYNGITATPIATELELTTEQVRSIRTYYGVPDIADRTEYQNWKKGIDAELAALESTQQAGEVEAFDPNPTPTGTLTKEPFIAELKYEKLIPEDVPTEEPVTPEVPKEPTRTGKAFPIGKAKPSTLSPGLEEQVFDGEIEFITLPSLKDPITGIDDFKAIKAGKKITKDDVGEVFVISQEVGEGRKRYVQVTYKGHKAFDEIEITDPMAQLDLKGVRDEGTSGPYKNAVTINGREYYAANSAIPTWVEGTGKLQIFEVSAPFEKSAETSKDSTDAWRRTVESKLNNSTNVKQTLKEINQDNVLRRAEGRPWLKSEEITDLYNAALGKLKKEVIIEEVNIGDHYRVNPVEIDGKNVNFETAKVIDITATGILLESTGVKTAGQTKIVNPESMKDVVIQKIQKDTDIQADVADQLTEEELEASKESKESSEKLGKNVEEIKSTLAESKTQSKEELDDEFNNNLGCE